MLGPTLPVEKFYLPFEDGPYRMSMGLVAGPADELISIDERYPAELAERRRILAAHGNEVAAATPGAAPACTALVGRLAEVLPRRYPAFFARTGDTLLNQLTGEAWPLDADPLTTAALLVQEDLCLLELRDGVPHLVAGTLLFTPGWRLLEKLGHPLGHVHGPVPFYADRLARPVDRFLRHLAPGKLAERLNWGLYENPALFRPGKHFRSELNPAVTAENAGETVFLRVERQTLSQLDAPGIILFTIRTHVYPLRRVISVKGAAARLAEAVRTMPSEMQLYKSLAPFRDACLSFLDAAL